MRFHYIVSQIKTARKTIEGRKQRIAELNDPNYEIPDFNRKQMLFFEKRDIEGLKRRIHELYQSLKEL